ncbi:26154_t:CDS:2, partial [Gigaspora rosea]
MAGAIEFPDLNKINFKTLMNGMILNGSNWVQFRNHFEHAIQQSMQTHKEHKIDFNRGTRRRRHEWELVEDTPNTILLDKTNFPEEMNEHLAAALNGGIGQGNLLYRDADGQSRQ